MIASLPAWRQQAREALNAHYGQEVKDQCDLDTADAIADALYALAQPQWLPMSSAPKDGTFFIARFDDPNMFRRLCWGNVMYRNPKIQDFVMTSGCSPSHLPRGWMPLPPLLPAPLVAQEAEK